MSLIPVAIGLAKPNQEIIDRIEGLLARAKEGDVRSLIYVTEDRDGSSTTSISETRNVMVMIGQCHRLAWRLQRSLDEAPSVAVPS